MRLDSTAPDVEALAATGVDLCLLSESVADGPEGTRLAALAPTVRLPDSTPRPRGWNCTAACSAGRMPRRAPRPSGPC